MMHMTLSPSKARIQPRRGAGFTLIEMLVVLSIVGILMAIAIPSYNGHVLKTRRAEAKATMVQVAQSLERFRTNNGTYSGFTPTSVDSPAEGTVRYTVTVTDLGDTTFTLTAEPQGSQADDRCGELTYDQAQRKGHEGSSGDRCW